MMEDKKKCLNCNKEVTGSYCGECGQSILTSRLGLKSLAEELQYGIFHINKGLLYTVKELLFRPGITIKNYLKGKRIKYSKPFLFLLVWGALYSLVFHFFHYFPMDKMNRQDSAILEYIPLYHWYAGHYALVVLLLIPFYALITYWIFSKKGYNYIEHLVVFSYLNGTKIFLLILSYLFIYFTESLHIYQVVQTLAELYLICGLTWFFKDTSWLRSLFKVLLSLVLTIIVMIILVVIVFEVLKHYNIKL